MAYQRNYGYQYETSPRKIQPEYTPQRKKKTTTKKSTAKKAKKVEKTKEKAKQKVKQKVKKNEKKQFIVLFAVVFIVLLGISYRNSVITERFNEKEKLKEKLSIMQKENDQLRVNIESSLNLNNIEQLAKEKLGMKKLDNNQKVYVSLPKEDYIEAASEEVVIKENTNKNIWQKIWKTITGAVE